MKASIEPLFTERDERAFSRLLKEALPNIIFLDRHAWEKPKLQSWDSIDQCKTAYTYIWNRPAKLRGAEIVDHRDLRWPETGPSIQFLRSRSDSNFLHAGSMSAGIDDDDPARQVMVDFIKLVWKIAKKFAPVRVDHVAPDDNSIITPRPPGFLVGPDAAAWCLADEHRYFKCWANTWFLRPCREQKSAMPRKARTK